MIYFQTGHNVTLVDVSKDVLKTSETRINESIKRVAKKKFKDDPSQGDNFVSEAIGRLQMSTEPNEALSEADLVVESVTENIDLKKKLFSTYDKVAPEKVQIHEKFCQDSLRMPISLFRLFLLQTPHLWQLETLPVHVLTEWIGLVACIFSTQFQL